MFQTHDNKNCSSFRKTTLGNRIYTLSSSVFTKLITFGSTKPTQQIMKLATLVKQLLFWTITLATLIYLWTTTTFSKRKPLVDYE